MSRRFWNAVRAVVLMAISACSPSLNWRVVPVEQLAALLPCKPDHAQRSVDWGGTPHELSMWGCEAGGALFAVSHIRVEEPSAARQLMGVWQEAALRNVHSSAPPQVAPFKSPVPPEQQTGPGVMVRVSGTDTRNQPIQAQLAWFSQGRDVYHLAVYAADITPAIAEPFFTELHWQ